MKRVLFAYDIVENDNEYVERLAEITQSIKDVEVYASLSEFWKPVRHYDFVIINWPDYLFNWRTDLNESDINSLENILSFFRKSGTKIATVLHDEYSHSDKSPLGKKIFDICYQQCDVLIHLGNYSQQKYKSDKFYSNQKHALIYHPLFKKFNLEISKAQARHDLKIDEKDFYIIIPGGIRHKYEYEYVLKIYEKIHIKNKKIHFLRSTAIDKPKRGWNSKFLIFKLKEWVAYKRKGVKHSYKFMPASILSKHFAASDLVILPRVDILNSGNVTLASQFDKLIIGAEISNIKEWLLEFNHIPIDFKSTELLNTDQFTKMIQNKIESKTLININERCSDEVIKQQIINALDIQ